MCDRTLRLVLTAALLGLVLMAKPVLAQTYPTKPSHILVPYAPGGIADVLPRPFREPLLLRGRQLGTERGLRPALGPRLRRRRAWGGRRRRVRGPLENHLRVDAAAAAQGDQGGGQKHSWRHGEDRPDDTGSVIVITVPRPTTESTSIRPSCIWTIR